MKRSRARQRRHELFSAALGSGIGQALAAWAAEWTHHVLEHDPVLRAELRKHSTAMFKRLVQLEKEEERRRGPRRRPAAPAARS